MSLETLKGRILSDAEKEAEALISSAGEKAASIEAAAEEEIKRNRQEEERELLTRVEALREGKRATVRLEAKKFELAERRRVIGTIYERALEALFALSEKESMELLSLLLTQYASAGDEVALAEDYPYPTAAEKLIAKMGFRVSNFRAKIRGGFYLYGKKCDRDISYAALIDEDREENQAELAAKLFKI